MPWIRTSLVAVVACCSFVSSARADLGPGPSPSVTRHLPVGSQRTGIFRSCGSGMGTGLAAIGITWGLTWAGLRVARRKDR